MRSIPRLFFYSILPFLIACSQPAEPDKNMSRLISVTDRSLSAAFRNNEDIRYSHPRLREQLPFCRQGQEAFYRRLDSLPATDAGINRQIVILFQELEDLNGRFKKEDMRLSLFPGIPELKRLEFKTFLSNMLKTGASYCIGCSFAYDNLPLCYETHLEKDSADYFSLFGSAYLVLSRGDIRIKNTAGKKIDLSKTTFTAPDRVYPLHNSILYSLDARNSQTVKSIELVLYDPISGRERIYPAQPVFK